MTLDVYRGHKTTIQQEILNAATAERWHPYPVLLLTTWPGTSFPHEHEQ